MPQGWSALPREFEERANVSSITAEAAAKPLIINSFTRSICVALPPFIAMKPVVPTVALSAVAPGVNAWFVKILCAISVILSGEGEDSSLPAPEPPPPSPRRADGRSLGRA